jgi:hypothetical protein
MDNLAPTKKDLLEKITSAPLTFTRKDFDDLVAKRTDKDVENKLTFDDLRTAMMTIYDANERSFLKESSSAFAGKLGVLNDWATWWRNKKFHRRIKSRQFQERTDKKIILAEGDSWFQFPFFVKDIVRHLIKNNNCAVKSIAAGGDWLANIIYEGKYIEELTLYQPDFLLVSGGGNDAVSEDRMAVFVSKCDIKRDLSKIVDHHFPEIYDLLLEKQTSRASESDQGKKAMLPKMSNDFFAFILVLKVQYYMMFHGIEEAKKFPNLKIITQGYDYALPRDGMNFKFPHFFQPFINGIMGSGGWLYTPLMIKEVTNRSEQEMIVRIWIDEVNFMYKDLAHRYGLKQVVHINFRGLATGKQDWYDELHLHSRKFKEAAEMYMDVIEGKVRPEKNVVDFGAVIAEREAVRATPEAALTL